MAKAPIRYSGPFNHGVPIVDKDGKPTPEFLRKWASQNDFNGDLTALEAAVTALQNRLIIAGTGLAGGGPLTADVTLELALETIARLLPSGGTTGQALVKNSNTDYDAVWATVAGGGSLLIGAGVPTSLQAAGTLYSRSDAAEVYSSQPITGIATTPVRVQSVSASGSTTSVVATLPGAPTVGNLLVAFVEKFQAFTVNAGWTLAETQPDSNSGNLYLLYRYVLPGDTAGPWTFGTGGGAFWHVAGFYELSGADPVWANAYAAHTKGLQTPPTPHTTTAIVTPAVNQLGIVAFACPVAAAPVGGDVSAGWTLDHGTTGGGYGSGSARQLFAAAGSNDQLTIGAGWVNSFDANYISALFAGVPGTPTANWVLIGDGTGDYFETTVLRTYAGFVLDTGNGSFLDIGAQ